MRMRLRSLLSYAGTFLTRPETILHSHGLCSLSFAQSWGIVIGGTILQNTLKTRIPASVVASLPKGSDIAYSIIPTINSLPEPLRIQVRTAFADGTRRIWQVMAGISGAGLISCFLMSEEVMRKDMDGTWGLKEREKASIAASSAENGSECA